jgi:environmental stress-induced protein Ves
MQVLRAADRVASPWKNGGGVTREIAAWPPGSGFDDFHWRVSMAEVRTDGPFSTFPNVDRILAVLEGRLALDICGRASVELTPGAAPLAFPGDTPTVGRLLEGPVTDLNVMSRRGVVRATLERFDVGSSGALEPSPSVRLLLVRGPLRAGIVDLAPNDALLIPAGGPALALHGTAGAYLAAFAAL